MMSLLVAWGNLRRVLRAYEKNSDPRRVSVLISKVLRAQKEYSEAVIVEATWDVVHILTSALKNGTCDRGLVVLALGAMRKARGE